MNRKGTTTRDTRLSVRVPIALKRAIEREAVRDQRTVADVVIATLEASFIVTEVTRSELRPHEARVVREFAEWVLRKTARKQRRIARNGGK
ncbi:MAG TPA: hypothetical protein VMJ10_10385 [Kofleriaceae bacterium]|nr:hypothetical protein [Kofleriaceae bacterium]